MTLKIRTNNVPRFTIDDFNLTEEERAEFNYNLDGRTFFRFKGNVYDLGEFIWIVPTGTKFLHAMECREPAFHGWDGYMSDSVFSGVLVKLVDAGEKVIVGQYFS